MVGAPRSEQTGRGVLHVARNYQRGSDRRRPFPPP
jgi:hypothetical protein